MQSDDLLIVDGAALSCATVAAVARVARYHQLSAEPFAAGAGADVAHVAHVSGQPAGLAVRGNEGR
jgi:tripartite-type tricarboxylate transporter receptor subunit TctC